MYPIVSCEWLNNNLDNPNIVILDATQQQNKDGKITVLENLQIKGTRKFDIKNIFSDTTKPFPNTLLSPEAFETACQNLGINKKSIIIVYDKLGIFSSPRVWWMFQIMGHKNCAVLNGGLPEWTANDFITEKELKNTYKTDDFKVNYHPDKVRKFKQIQQNCENRKELVIDVRSSDRFYSLRVESRVGLRSGNIPNAINIPYQEVLKNGMFKSKEAILDVLKVINTDKTLVFSCGSGITACIVYLASFLVLENEIAVYDGSWSEWGTLTK